MTVATRLRCDGTNDHCSITNLRLSLQSKNDKIQSAFDEIKGVIVSRAACAGGTVLSKVKKKSSAGTTPNEPA